MPLLPVALDFFAAFVTVITAPVVLLESLRLWSRRRQDAVLLVLAVSAATLVAVALQFVLLRPRPEVVSAVLSAPPTPSFPSGHAALAFAAATFLALLNPRRSLWVLSAAAIVAWSRVQLGHHFVSDVLVGSVVGAATGALAYGAFLAPDAQRPRWAWWLWPQTSVIILATVAAYLGLTHMRVLTFPGADKVLHFTLYGLFSLLLVGWFARYQARSVVLILAALATAEEFSQALSPVRTFDLGDLACTLGGIFLFGWFAARARTVVVDCRQAGAENPQRP